MATPLSLSYQKYILPHTVRIYRKYTTTDNKSFTEASSGFLFATGTSEDDKFTLYAIATARHCVVDIPNVDSIEWTIYRYTPNGSRTLTFKSKGNLDYHPGSPLLLRSVETDYDAALLSVPETNPDDPFINVKDIDMQKFTHPNVSLKAGNPVAWAGYPCFLEKHLKRPQQCFYSGTISAFVSQQSSPVYLVDGHNVRGVSGGPVWYADENRSSFIGIVTGYVFPDDNSTDNQFPGLCVFTPVNELVKEFVRCANITSN